jgi:hypothetical protein
LLLRRTKGFGMDHYLMFCIYHGNTIITLDHSLGGLHLRRVIVGDVAFDGSFLPLFVIMSGKERTDLLDMFGERRNVLLALRRKILCICLLMTGNNVFNGLLHLLLFMGEFFFRTAPFLGGIGRKLYPIDGKHLFADEVRLITYFFIQCGDEIGNGGEMRSGITG